MWKDCFRNYMGCLIFYTNRKKLGQKESTRGAHALVLFASKSVATVEKGMSIISWAHSKTKQNKTKQNNISSAHRELQRDMSMEDKGCEMFFRIVFSPPFNNGGRFLGLNSLPNTIIFAFDHCRSVLNLLFYPFQYGVLQNGSHYSYRFGPG